MKILYSQTEKTNIFGLHSFGVKKCCLKKLQIDHDTKNITKKTHRHTGVEIHIVTKGVQVYEMAGQTHTVSRGQFIMIYPNVPHKVVSLVSDTQKYSITFTFSFSNKVTAQYTQGDLPERLLEHILFIEKEVNLRKEISALLIENCLLEIIVTFFRIAGMKEKKRHSTKCGKYRFNNCETIHCRQY